MPVPQDFDLKTVEQTDTPILARVRHAGSLLTQAAISSITYLVKNKAGTTTSSGSFTVASVVFDALQTADRWTLDATGFNFAGTLPAACFPAPGWHRAEIKFTPASGSAFYLRARIYADSLQTV
jgi:hypothetical protein